MSKVAILLIGVVIALSASAASSRLGVVQQQTPEKPSTDPARAVKVTITTGGGLFGPSKNRYKLGEQVPVTITMTNTSNQPVYVCDSDTLYQDLPKLVTGGQTLSYGKWQSYLLDDSKKNSSCKNEDLPEPMVLRPNEPKVVDWLILVDSSVSTGTLAWYDSLPAGKYELSIQRRFGCCDGPMVESNKIDFEVVPRTHGKKGAD
jgi:hypothetical protein